MYKKSSCLLTAKKPVTITNTEQFMLVGKITVLSNPYGTHKHPVWRKAEFLNVTAGGKYSYHCIKRLPFSDSLDPNG
jgi:hypothetical protein